MRRIVKIHRRSMMRRSMGMSLILLCGMSASALAQDTALAKDAARPAPKRSITVPCCQCIDGKSQTINLNTGTAPWTSTTGTVTVVPSPASAWASKSPAKWIYTGSNAAGLYTYNLNIHVPKDCIIPMDVSFKGTAYGDNNIVVKLDDRQLGTTAVSSGGQANYGFRDPYGVNVGSTLSGGDHVISVTVRNDEGPTGFLFNGSLTFTCSKGPLTKKI